MPLRRSNPALQAITSPAARIHTTADDHIFCFARKNGERELLVLLNLSSLDLKFEMRSENIKGNYKDIFKGQAYQFPAEKHIELNAWNYLVLEK